MISYAQNAEDVVLMRALAGVANGFYVDVGAWHPTIDSVTKVFYDAGWNGINLEPLPALLAMFEAERGRDTNLALAASDRAGMATLLAPRLSMLATLNPAVIDPAIPAYSDVDRIDVRTMPLTDILERHAGNRLIHFLKIDVEGHETEVLRGLDFRRHRPIVLVIEATSPMTNEPNWSAWEPMVLAGGYQFALFDGLNRFYVCSERADLLPKLSFAANCVDGYITHREALVRGRLELAEQELSRLRQALAAQAAPSAGAARQ